MLKQHLITHYLGEKQLVTIIPQHHGQAAQLAARYAIITLVVCIAHYIAQQVINNHHIVSLISLISLIVAFGLFSYHFLLLYLDSVVINTQGIIIMDQVGLYDFSQTRFDRDTVQSISYHQHGFIDRILQTGDVIIGIEHGTNHIIPNVIQPRKRCDRLNHYKHEAILERAKQIALSQESNQQETTPQYDKFELLVDKLSDIIVDYMQQPRTSEAILEGQIDEIEDDYPTLYKS